MDRTLLNLMSLVLSGTGLYVVLTGYDPPEANLPYWDSNPFLEERSAIEAATTAWFTPVALVGIVLQLFAEVLGDRIPLRQHSLSFYALAAAALTVSAVVLARVLRHSAQHSAREKWMPKVLEQHRDQFDRARFCLLHGGLFPEHHAEAEKYHDGTWPNPSADNLKTVDSTLEQMEKLFEILPKDSRNARLNRLGQLYGISPLPV